MSSLQYDTTSGSLLYESGSDSLMRDCCCDDCCEEMTTVPTFANYQIAFGDTQGVVCYCIDDNTCTEEYQIASAMSTDGGSTWGTISYTTVSLITPNEPCDYVPASLEAGGGDGDACDESVTITGLSHGTNHVWGVNMRKRNITLGCDGPWQNSWDGSNPFVPAATWTMQA